MCVYRYVPCTTSHKSVFAAVELLAAASFNDAKTPVCTPWQSYHRNGFQAHQLQYRALDCAFYLFCLGALALLQRFKNGASADPPCCNRAGLCSPVFKSVIVYFRAPQSLESALNTECGGRHWGLVAHCCLSVVSVVHRADTPLCSKSNLAQAENKLHYPPFCLSTTDCPFLSVSSSRL